MYDEEIEKAVLYYIIFKNEELDIEESDFINIKKRQTNLPLYVAERMGFEPMWLLAKRFSRPPRYDRFDTSPYRLEYNITAFCGCQELII